MTIERLLTPPGRIVWGNPAKSTVKKNLQTKQPVLKDGKPVEQWAFGVAFAKPDFNQHILPFLQQEAASVFPNGIPPHFSWKFKDGDGVDRKGQPFSSREGYAGHMVLTVSTEAFAPQIFKFENGTYRQIDANEIKTGDFVRLNLNVKANAPANPTQTPGLYINPNGIEWLAYGQEIINSGGDPDDMFGGQPVTALPAGASLTPVSGAPAGSVMPGMAPQPVPVAQLHAGGAMPPQPYPAPAHDFVQNAGYQQSLPQPYAGGVAPQPAPVTAQGTYGAAPATTYPGNIPGMPQPR
jgi:hypothetical protein